MSTESRNSPSSALRTEPSAERGPDDLWGSEPRSPVEFAPHIAGSRNRRRLIAGAVGLALASGVLGVAVGSNMSSGPPKPDPAALAPPGASPGPAGGSAAPASSLTVKAILAKVGPSVVDVVA